MHWLICHNHKLGKMFSAPLHAVKGRGCDLGHVDLLPLWREEVRVEPGPLWHGSVESVKDLEEVERFSFFFKVYFSVHWGWRGGSFQVSIEHDGSNILENKHTITDAQFVICFIARRVIHSTSYTYVSKNTHTHLPPLLYYMQKHPSSPDTNYSVNKLQDKAQVHVRLNFTLMSWPKVMDCSLLQLHWVLPGFFLKRKTQHPHVAVNFSKTFHSS